MHRFGLDGQALICTDRMLDFIGPGKPSSLVTTLLNHPSLLRGSLLEAEWGSLEWRPGWALLGAKTSSREQRLDFDLVGTSPKVFVRETPGATRMSCQSGSSTVGCISIWVTMTLSDMSDRLSLLSSHSMFCYIGWMVQMTFMVIFIMIIIVLL